MLTRCGHDDADQGKVKLPPETKIIWWPTAALASLKETPPRTKINSRDFEIPERARRNPLATRTQEGVCATLACWEAVSRPIQVPNDLPCHADSINDRVAGAEVTNDHDLKTGAGRSRTSRRVRSPFALVESTESAGGFAIPSTIDPSIILSGSGALDPVRDVARVITVATRDCVVIGAWAGRVGEGVAVHQPDAGDLGQQGCVHGCESPSVGDRADAGRSSA